MRVGDDRSPEVPVGLAVPALLLVGGFDCEGGLLSGYVAAVGALVLLAGGGIGGAAAGLPPSSGPPFLPLP